jgi:hypothetical protein
MSEHGKATWGNEPEVEAHHRGHNLNANEDVADDEQADADEDEPADD